jgi:hypothetical protein
MTDHPVDISCSIAEYVSIAFHQNEIPIVHELAIQNKSGRDLVDVSAHLVSEPFFLVPSVWRIERIADSATHHNRRPDPRLDTGLLLKLGEGVRADVTISVEEGGEELARRQATIRLLPPSHWGGTGAAPELLAAFIRPNDPAVDVILHEAAGKLAAAGRENAIDGYRSARKARVWEIAEAIWATLASRSLTSG